MTSRSSHSMKSQEDRKRYGAMLRSSQNEKKTSEEDEEDLDRTDSSSAGLDRGIQKRENRPRNTSRQISEKIKEKWYWGLIAPIILALFLHYLALNNDIGALEERSKDIPVMKEMINSIDKNLEIIKVGMEKNSEIYDLKLENLEKDVEELKVKK